MTFRMSYRSYDVFPKSNSVIDETRWAVKSIWNISIILLLVTNISKHGSSLLYILFLFFVIRNDSQLFISSIVGKINVPRIFTNLMKNIKQISSFFMDRCLCVSIDLLIELQIE